MKHSFDYYKKRSIFLSGLLIILTSFFLVITISSVSHPLIMFLLLTTYGIIGLATIIALGNNLRNLMILYLFRNQRSIDYSNKYSNLHKQGETKTNDDKV